MPAANQTKPSRVTFRPPTGEPESEIPPGIFADLPQPVRTELIPVKDIERDEAVNPRPVDLVWVSKTAEEFCSEGIGTPVVSRRASGQIVAIDGQNRIALLRKVGWGDRSVECQVHEGLTLSEEARLFLFLAKHRGLTPLSRFWARKTQGEQKVLDIIKTVENNGYKIGQPAAGDTINAVKTLEQIWDTDTRRHPHDKPSTLNTVLNVLVRAWQHSDGVTDRDIIGGTGLLYLLFGDDPGIDQEYLIRVLAGTYPDAPRKLKTKGDGARDIVRGSIAKGVAYQIYRDYNDSRPRGVKKLPQFPGLA